MVNPQQVCIHEHEPFEPDQAPQRALGLGVGPVSGRQIEADATDLDGAGAADGGQEGVEVVGAPEVEGIVLVPDVEGFEQDGAAGLDNGEGGGWGGGSHGFFYLFPGSETAPALLAHPFGDVGEVGIWFGGEIGEIVCCSSGWGKRSDPWGRRRDVNDEDVVVDAFTNNVRKRKERSRNSGGRHFDLDSSLIYEGKSDGKVEAS